jgi:hypothetical protein
MEDVVNERYHGWRMPGASLHSSTTSSGIVSTYEGKQNFFVGGMLSGDTLQSPSVPQAMMPGACQATQNFLVGGMLSGDALQSPSVPQPTISMAHSECGGGNDTKRAKPMRADGIKLKGIDIQRYQAC